MTSTTEGRLIFLRSTKQSDKISTDQINHIHYRQEVFMPFIQNTRECYLQREECEGEDDIDDDNL